MKPTPRTHPYLPGETNHAPLKPQLLCAECGMPKSNTRHQLPAQPKAVTEFEHRRIGERP